MTETKLAEAENVTKLKYTIDYTNSRLGEYQHRIGVMSDLHDSKIKADRERFDRTTCEATFRELGHFLGELITPESKNYLYNSLSDRCRPISAMFGDIKRSLDSSELSDILSSCYRYLKRIRTVLYEADLYKTRGIENPSARLEYSLEQKAQFLLLKLYFQHIHDNFDDPDEDYAGTYPVEETLLSNGVLVEREELKAVVHLLRNRGHIGAYLEHGMFTAELTPTGIKHLINNKARILKSVYGREPRMLKYASLQISGTNHYEKSALSTAMKKKFDVVFRELEKIKYDNSQLAASLEELRRDLDTLKKVYPKIKSEKKVWEWSLQSVLRHAVFTNVLDVEKAQFIYEKLAGFAKASLPAFKDVLQLS